MRTDLEQPASSPTVPTRRPLAVRVLLRVAAGVVLVLGLGGPSPGYLGGCGSGTAGVDPVQFCVDKEVYVCARECGTGRYTPETCTGGPTVECGSDAYREMNIRRRCAGATFLPGCSPTQAQAGACIAVLMDPGLLSTPSRDFAECNLCAAAPLLGPDPDGI